MTLRQVVELVRPQLGRAAARMWAAATSREWYLTWLATCHDLVRATAPLLAEAVTESVRRGEGRLAAYFADQVRAEFGHDAWLRADYAAAGGDPAELAQRVPAPAAARLVGAQHYWLRHAHPVALTGHIAVLEWHPPAPGLAAVLVRRTGLPAAAFSTLRRHAELDAAHGAELADLLAGMALTGPQQRLVTTSALTTAHGLVGLMTDLGGPRWHTGPASTSSASTPASSPTSSAPCWNP
ncbi:MAG TPA: iron-containing redox enzyme family protein [Pilimelia sp.]|nr:iron-containing redox enzyme family protein [Pilimelia sp.]